jgi:hypothetical protein
MPYRRVRSVVRKVGVGSVSLFLMVGVADYVATPASTALAAIVKIVENNSNGSSIEGRVQGSTHGGHIMIRIEHRVDGKIVVLDVVPVGSDGHFRVPIAPGNYIVNVIHGSKYVVEHVDITSGHSAYLVVTAHGPGSTFGVAPVVFNY